MKKFTATTLEAAYAKATKEYNCSIVDLDCEIVQHPSSGFFGFFVKEAIIIVAQKVRSDKKESKKKEPKQETKKTKVKAKVVAEKKLDEKVIEKTIEPKEDTKPKSNPVKPTESENTEKIVLDSFFNEDDVETQAEADTVSLSDENPNNIPLQEEIEKELKELMQLSCFDIDIVEVDVIEDTAYIFMDGEDAALLIGKEGYRYNALSYLVSNWLQNKHKLYIKLEIAQFLASQQEMIRSYIQPVIEHVEQEGWGRTRSLDGILVQIALEQLRETFPNKYVAIKRTRNGDRYVLINEFNKR